MTIEDRDRWRSIALFKREQIKRREKHDVKCNYCGYTYRKRYELVKDISYCPNCYSKDVVGIDPFYYYGREENEQIRFSYD